MSDDHQNQELINKLAAYRAFLESRIHRADQLTTQFLDQVREHREKRGVHDSVLATYGTDLADYAAIVFNVRIDLDRFDQTFGAWLGLGGGFGAETHRRETFHAVHIARLIKIGELTARCQGLIPGLPPELQRQASWKAFVGHFGLFNQFDVGEAFDPTCEPEDCEKAFDMGFFGVMRAYHRQANKLIDSNRRGQYPRINADEAVAEYRAFLRDAPGASFPPDPEGTHP